MGQGGLIVYYMDAPTNLKHKPLVSIDDYDSNDGIYASNTDAMALSIGYAQYSNDKDTLTGKVWRRGHDKWSRMSEELPIHRIFDLTILFLSVLTKEDKIRCDLGKYKVHDDGEQVIRNLSSRGKLSEVLNDRIDMLKELIEKF